MTRDSRHRPIFLIAAVLLLSGCIHSQAYKAHTLMNEHMFAENRYEENCEPFSLKPYCTVEVQKKLDTAKKHLLELSQAITLGGSAKLQLGLSESDLKGLKDVR